jgi:hypothetical protein
MQNCKNRMALEKSLPQGNLPLSSNDTVVSQSANHATFDSSAVKTDCDGAGVESTINFTQTMKTECDVADGESNLNFTQSLPAMSYLGETGRAFDLNHRSGVNSTLHDDIQKYENMHRNMVEDYKTGGSASKFVVVQLSRALGMGNRLLILVGSFLLSLLTNRGLLVHWPSHPAPMEHLFTLPPGVPP